MDSYKIFFRRSVIKELKNVPKKDLQRIMKRIEKLARNPRPQGYEKISGQDHFRIRQGNYRIVYSIQDDELTIWIVKIGHRREIYRQLVKNRFDKSVRE
ncbi:MAG: type II toxin-antitoxin system RelE/ParE family toxin [Acidobacteria bacterium]|nr:type II toxin-antitoxin system RelE/ParE family toxin [Acidobacteriota bacterium]